MFVTIIIGAISSILFIVLLIRFKERMAALVAWVMGSLIGARPKPSNSPQDSQPSTSPNRVKFKSLNARLRLKKSLEDPLFSTSLKTPIEDIIEESLIEDLKPESSQSPNVKKKNKAVKKLKTIQEGLVIRETSREENIGHSFLKVKPSEKSNNPTVDKQKKSNKAPKVETPESAGPSVEDNNGYSFVPVKEKGPKKPKTTKRQIERTGSKELLNLSSNKNNPKKINELVPGSSLVEHYGSRKQYKESEATEKLVCVTDLNQLGNKPESTKEVRESKKVQSSITYANIVSQKFSNSTESTKSDENISIVQNCGVNSSEELENFPPLEQIDGSCWDQTVENTEVDDFKSNSNGGFEDDCVIIPIVDYLEEQTNTVQDAGISELPFKVSSYQDLTNENDLTNSRQVENNYVESHFQNYKSISDSNDFERNETSFGLKTTHDPLNAIPVDEQVKLIEIKFDDIIKGSDKKFCSEFSDDEEHIKRYGDLPFENIACSQLNNSQSDQILGEIIENRETSFNLNEHISVFQEENTVTAKAVIQEPEQVQEFVEDPQIPPEIKNQKELPPKFIDEVSTEDLLNTSVSSITESEETPSKRDIDDIFKPLVEPLESSNLILSQSIKSQSAKLTEETRSSKITPQKGKNETATVNELFRKIENPQHTVLSSIEHPREKKLKLSTMTQVRVLTLNDQEHQESTLYRIEKNWIIQFRLGPSLLGRKVNLYCNYPEEKNDNLLEFKRCSYQLLNWLQDDGCKYSDDTALYTQITAKLSGGFHYYFTYDDSDSSEISEMQGSGYFLVDPILKYGNNEALSLDCIQCQTVLAKNLGSFSTWEKKLKVTKESGYNMVHFTPIQELGVSNSAYSLSEQLKLNPAFNKKNGNKPTFEEVEQLIAKLRKEWKIASICDIVLNHTANESKWLQEHPETTYNCLNCPYLRPAYLLDAAFHQFSLDVKKGLYEDKGIPAEVNSEDHLGAIRYHIRESVINHLNIPELFICNVNSLVAEFSMRIRKIPTTPKTGNETEELKVLQDPEYKRLASTVDMDLALKLYNIYRADCFDEETRIKRCAEDFKNKLEALNQVIIDEVDEHLNAAIQNIIAGIKYFRVQDEGPKFREINVKTPLVYRYFTDHGTPTSIQEHEEIMYSENGRFLMAHNGWIMNADPLRNFAAAGTNVYIRRELIAWSDSVKLRYGDKPEDCPFLWNHMRTYVEQTAKIFDGIRLDNCHSTPIAVAEYLLDCARRVKPDLYVVAELFTNSDMTDNIFVNRLGITSLIREAMSAWDSHEEGRLVYRYGGCPVGSFYQPNIRPLMPSIAHALFLDLTHDNPSPVEKRSVFDLLPSSALVNMACCASGSNRGYDELIPHHIHVVDETRHYTEWTDDENVAVGNLRYVTNKSGIIAAKRAINELHFKLGKEGFSQVYVDQMDPDIVAVTRHCPDTHQSYILVAFTAFGQPCDDAQRGIQPLRVEGVLDEIVLEATLSHINTKSGGSKFAKTENFVKDNKWMNGLSEYQVQMQEHIKVEESDVFEKVDSHTDNVTQLNFKNFKPGSIAVVKMSLPDSMRESVEKVRSLVNQFSVTKQTELSTIVSKLTLADLNRALYRCDQEEKDEGHGFGTYNIPNFESLVYSGLQGFMSLLSKIRPNNDLGHPMCANLRDGNWMIDYIWQRLKFDEGTCDLGQWIEENTKSFSSIPRYLIPCYFDLIVTGVYVMLMEQCYKLMSDFVKNGSTFVRGLSLGSVQFAAYIKSANLPVLSPNLAPPKPPTRKDVSGEPDQACVTLSAGLPHFSVGYMRNWGRDTFISLRGLFILTGRFEEARQHILGYAACLRHGLIPNLLDGGRNSRFNCRDAVWWWLYCIKEYAEESPNGISILSDKVSRIFPTDDSTAQEPGAVDQNLCDIIQEALQVHFQGLAFRERNAGRQIDEHMTDRGFNNQVGVHPETGFVFGGNEWNCGTWMDKMGSSDKAGNRGRPATPRDGSAVELIGLSKAVLSWLWKLSQDGKYEYNGVERTHKNGSVTKWTFKEWADKIQNNFEKYFWVNCTPSDGEIQPELINKRGIYKDCYGASQAWTDFQLRCNFPIAMVAAPELFNPQHAWIALQQAEKYLLGPLGMKTLDPEDWAYNGDYDNSNDSDDFKLANGFNYHQGPEWVWPVGFFLRAKLHFAAQNGALKETVNTTKVILSKHFVELQTTAWKGLPELTNSNGSFCKDSSRTQAWSMACILEVLHDLQKIAAQQQIIVN